MSTTSDQMARNRAASRGKIPARSPGPQPLASPGIFSLTNNHLGAEIVGSANTEYCICSSVPTPDPFCEDCGKRTGSRCTAAPTEAKPQRRAHCRRCGAVVSGEGSACQVCGELTTSGGDQSAKRDSLGDFLDALESKILFLEIPYLSFAKESSHHVSVPPLEAFRKLPLFFRLLD